MSAATLAPEDLAGQVMLAARIQRIVTARYVRECGDAPDAGELEALYICRYLRADRTPEAVRAHLGLCRVVRRDLLAFGLTAPRHGELLDLLYQYCDFGGMKWERGRWRDAAAYLAEVLARHSQPAAG